MEGVRRTGTPHVVRGQRPRTLTYALRRRAARRCRRRSWGPRAAGCGRQQRYGLYDYSRIMRVPHWGHFFWAHGSPAMCGSRCPHAGQTHSPPGPAALGPPMRPGLRPAPRPPPAPQPPPLPLHSRPTLFPPEKLQLPTYMGVLLLWGSRSSTWAASASTSALWYSSTSPASQRRASSGSSGSWASSGA